MSEHQLIGEPWPDQALNAFFIERQQGFLKKSIKASHSEVQKQEIMAACKQQFSKTNWIPDAAKRAGQIKTSTHPCTFSHPSARKNKNGYVTPILATPNRKPDGYLRSGNVNVESDALGNAAALEVYKFLTLTLSDNQSVLQHIAQDSEIAKAMLVGEDYATLKDGFLAMAVNEGDRVTSSKIKQVYFPVKSDYHLLSILSPSGIMFEMRKRLDNVRFSDTAKHLRSKKHEKQYDDRILTEISQLTSLKYGGTKPQNISVLNNQNGGRVHLLRSAPPKRFQYETPLPKHSVFDNCLSDKSYACKSTFKSLHRLLITWDSNPLPQRNKHTAKENRLLELLVYIHLTMQSLRNTLNSQANSSIDHLTCAEQAWIKEEPLEEDHKTALCKKIAKWIMESLTKYKPKVTLADDELKYLNGFVHTHTEVWQ